MRSIAVYCGSSNHVNIIYKNEAKKLGSLLAKHKIKLVYGGGNMGLMGILANSVLDGGGDVYGVSDLRLLPHCLSHLLFLHYQKVLKVYFTVSPKYSMIKFW